jgi:hypothetical protein
MASDKETIRAMADHMVALAQLLTEHVTECDPQPVQQPAPAPLPQQNAAPQPVQSGPPEANPDPDWLCPVHRSRRVVPGGVSKRTGNPYQPFARCSEFSCDEKPPRNRESAPARALPPSQSSRLP